LFAGQASQAKRSWQNQVAVCQTLYVSETLAPTVLNDEELVAQLAKSEQAIGRELPLDIVGDLEGMKACPSRCVQSA
jgi:hypothetical protein